MGDRRRRQPLPRRAQRPVVRERRLRPRAARRGRGGAAQAARRSTRSRAATCRRSSWASGSTRCSAATARRFYSNSGSEANELAFKLVRQYHQLRGEQQRFKIIARYRAYHGSTLGALSATGQAMRRVGYEPLAPGFLHVAPPDPYRDGIADDDLDAYGRRCAADLERTIEFELPETVAAVIMEPIITGGGILIPPDSYLPAVKAAVRAPRRAADRRRGDLRLRAHRQLVRPRRQRRAARHRDDGQGDHERVLPARRHGRRRRDLRRLPGRPGATPGRLRHINTFGGHPAGCAVALETIAIMEEEGLVERSASARRDAARAAAGRARRPPAGRRRARPRAADRHRARGRPRDARAGRARASPPASSPRRRSAGCCSAATSTRRPAWTT